MATFTCADMGVMVGDSCGKPFGKANVTNHPGLGLVYACGPKTVPVKRAFLNIAIVGWGGVGRGGGAC